jgi:type II secretory pathway predicted ATPase ExeA/septal ring-binding cell division protein DamX
MYEEYFGLERPPFKITPDTSLFYDGGKRGDILAALVYAVHRGEGIVKVVGEVGSGKTMLCRMLQLKLPDTVEIVYIANPSVSADDILFVIALELSLPVAKDASKHEVMHMLQDYLLQRHMENKQVVLFVEEAQGMPLDTLEEIRLLSNLETDEHKLLQIILFGQPELDQNLAQRSIRQLRERITHNFELEPLTRDEIHYYLNFRMRQVGYTGPELINNTLAKKVERHSEGLLRRINIIADKILLSAFADGTHNLSSKHVIAAVNDSSFNQEVRRKSSSTLWFGLLLVAVLGLVLYQSRDHWMTLAAVYISPQQEGSQQEGPQQDKTLASGDPIAAVAVTESEPDAVDAPSVDTQAMPEVDAVVEPATRQAEAAIEAPLQNEAPREAAESEVQADTPAAPVEADAPAAEILAQPEPLQAPESEIATLQPAAGDAPQIETPATRDDADLVSADEYSQWLDIKLAQSIEWLANASGKKLSIQVFMRKKGAAGELVYYLRNEWPLDLSDTYLYEVLIEDKVFYRAFYSEFDSLDLARAHIEKLPDNVKANSPYVHSVYRMRKDLL